MSKEPICLIQWLDPGEYQEVIGTWNAYKAQLNIRLNLHFPGSVAAVRASIVDWLTENDNSQILYIGSHGNEHELGPASIVPGLAWADLAASLKVAQAKPALILGACHSSHVAGAWFPWPKEGPPVESITTFKTAIKPDLLEAVLKRALDVGGLSPVVFADEELPKLIEAASGGRVEQFFPARTKARQDRYVNVTSYDEEVGVTLKKALEGGNLRPRLKYSVR